MSDPAQPDDAAALAELREFQAGFATLLLATVSPSGEPDASYAAYVERDGDFYLYVSELATHTRNLLTTGQASVLFIEDEARASSAFTRRRLTFQCQAHEVPRDNADHAAILDAFQARFGALINTLLRLPDFHLLRLHPLRGRWVVGFARAFSLAGDRLTHLRPAPERAVPPA